MIPGKYSEVAGQSYSGTGERRVRGLLVRDIVDDQARLKSRGEGVSQRRADEPPAATPMMSLGVRRV